MHDFPAMAEAHEWTLRRLREMAGRLTEQAYLRASAAMGQDDTAHARWMLVFDRMARGLRLSIALEARLARERRCEARDIEREMAREAANDAAPGARGEVPAPAGAPARAAGPWEGEREADREDDDDGLPETAPLAERIGRVRAILHGAEAPEPAARLARAERQALARLRAERARRAARDLPPDEPWDVLTPIDLAEHVDLAEHAEPPWPGAG